MKIVATFCILFFALSMNAQQSLAGIWNTGKDNTKIEISSTDDVYNGTVVSSDNDKVKIGNQFLKDVKWVDGKWKGKLYSPKKDKWYTAVLEETGDQLLVKVKAGMTSRTLEWKKE